jgi:hypothetical protein
VAHFLQLSRRSWSDLFDRFYLDALSKLCHVLACPTEGPSLRQGFFLLTKSPYIYWIYLGTILTLPLSYYFIFWDFPGPYQNDTDNTLINNVVKLLVILFTFHQVLFVVNIPHRPRLSYLLMHFFIFIILFIVVLGIRWYTNVDRPFVDMFFFSYAPIVPVLLVRLWVSMSGVYRIVLLGIMAAGTLTLIWGEACVENSANVYQCVHMSPGELFNNSEEMLMFWLPINIYVPLVNFSVDWISLAITLRLFVRAALAGRFIDKLVH